MGFARGYLLGEKTREALKLRFDKRLRLEFHGAKITSDAGLDAAGCNWGSALGWLDNQAQRVIYCRPQGR